MFNVVDKHQRVVKWILIVITMSFILWGIGNYLGMAMNDGFVASVGHTKIYPSDIDHALDSNPELQGNKIEALYSLINRALLLAQINALHMVVPVATLQDAIANIDAFKDKDGHFSLKKYQQFLQDRLMHASTIEDNVKHQIILDQFAKTLTMSAFNNESAVDGKFIDLLSTERTASQYVVLASSFMNRINVSDNEIESYYNTHLRFFTTPASAEIQYITLKSNNTHDLDKLNDLTYNHPKDLSYAANVLHLAIQNGSVTKGDISGMFANPKIQKAIFTPDVIKNHNNSEVVDLGATIGYVVYHVVSYHDAVIRSESSVKEQIAKQLKLSNGSKFAASYGAFLINKLESGSVALSFTNPVKVNLLTPTPGISALAGSKIFERNSFPNYVGDTNSNGDFVIYKVIARNHNANLERQAKAIVNKFNLQMDNLKFGLYVGNLRGHFGVSIHSEYLQLVNY